MVIRERRCVRCQTWTGVRPDGSFTGYTLHPFVSRVRGRAVEQMTVFCAPCFEALGNAAARDAAAIGRPAEVELELATA